MFDVCLLVCFDLYVPSTIFQLDRDRSSWVEPVRNNPLDTPSYWVIFHAFLSSADYFQDQLFREILSGIPSLSNSLDPDQARHFVGPDLGPNCFQQTTLVDKKLRVLF